MTSGNSSFVSGLAGQRVAITAAGSGIGFAIARLLHAEGCRLAICDVSEAALANARTALPGVVAVVADVSQEEEVGAFFTTITGKLDGLDALINNAGIAGPTGAVEDISPEEWRRCIDVDLTGQFLCTRLAVPLLKAAGGGSIVNMSSVAGRHGYALRTPYAAAKFGVIGFTQSLAKELGPFNIRVNAILPGIVEGPRIEAVIRDKAAKLGLSHNEMTSRYLEHVSLRRMVSPDDVAAMVAFVLSDGGRNISGQSLGVDGNVETLV